MLTGWVIYDMQQYDRNRWFADRLLTCGKRIAKMELVITQQLWYGHENGQIVFKYRGRIVTPPDFAIVRTISPLLSFCLEKAGTRVYNRAEVSWICNDKRLTYAVLSCTGIPVMKTRFCDGFSEPDFDGAAECFSPPSDFAEADQLYTDLPEYPAVIKSASGHGGKEVFLAENQSELAACRYRLGDKPYVLQELCRPWGRDLRVYILGGKVLASILRVSDSFRSNFSLGGQAQLYSLNEQEMALVKKIIGVFPAQTDFIGIDFLVSEDGLVFNEIEDVVGTRMLYACTDLDAAEELIHYIQMQQ